MTDAHDVHDDDRQRGDAPEHRRPGDDEHDHPVLEAFNAEAVVERPGELDEEPSPTKDARVQPPQ